MKVQPRTREPIQAALRRLKRLLQREGTLTELRRHEHYVKPSARRRSKAHKRQQARAKAEARARDEAGSNGRLS